MWNFKKQTATNGILQHEHEIINWGKSMEWAHLVHCVSNVERWYCAAVYLTHKQLVHTTNVSIVTMTSCPKNKIQNAIERFGQAVMVLTLVSKHFEKKTTTVSFVNLVGPPWSHACSPETRHLAKKVTPAQSTFMLPCRFFTTNSRLPSVLLFDRGSSKLFIMWIAKPLFNVGVCDILDIPKHTSLSLRPLPFCYFEALRGGN